MCKNLIVSLTLSVFAPNVETITKWGLRAFMLAGHGSESW